MKSKPGVDFSTIIYKPLEELAVDANFIAMGKVAFSQTKFILHTEFEDAWQSFLLHLLRGRAVEKYDPSKCRGRFCLYIWRVLTRFFIDLSRQSTKNLPVGWSISEDCNDACLPFTVTPRYTGSLQAFELGRVEVTLTLDWIEKNVVSKMLVYKKPKGTKGREIVNLVEVFRMMREGMPYSEIAKVCGVKKVSVYHWLHRISAQVQRPFLEATEN